MRWHAQALRCSRALIFRGYRKGSYAAQSPYNALMTVLTRRGRYEVQGLLSDGPLTKRDLVALSRACAKNGVKVISTRRHGRQALIKAAG